MGNLTKCGEMHTGNGYSDIMFDSDSGDLVLMDDVAGNCIISEITINGVSVVPEDNAVAKICEFYGCKGAVLSSDYLITFDEDAAYFRPYTDATNPVRIVQYDLSQSYDE